eukprot:maker-scaffold348_size200312-snap-gene-0.28 protein:Tk10904 transcript:maker-scaffold348_size200312-snap-gene-0.28-mRNA-1 annotation:"glycoprotein-n-acetylgalactosamine 3-beta-galactosyltransferase 1-like isoform x3"
MWTDHPVSGPNKYMYHVEHEWPRQFSSFNPKFWRNCTAHSFTKHCFDRVYLWQHCRQHQVQAAKVVRLDLRHVEDLLKDPRVVRFEDLLNNPAVQFRKLFQFLTIPYEPVIADRVKKHTYIGTDESNPMRRGFHLFPKGTIIRLKRIQVKLWSQIWARRAVSWRLILCLLIGCNFVYLNNNQSPEDEVPNSAASDGLASVLMNRLLSKQEPIIKRGPKILCWILTQPKNKEDRAQAVKNTWGPRCDKLLFMSSESDTDDTSVIPLNVTEDRQHLWTKTRLSLEYIYQTHYSGYDWFLKADDDTYVIMENLRKFLSDYQPSDSIYFGCRFKLFMKQGYMSGGAGYILSREALRKFAVEGLQNTSKPLNQCQKKEATSEDVQLGYCMEYLKVRAMNTTDAQGRHRFLPMDPSFFLIEEHNLMKDFWLFNYVLEPLTTRQELRRKVIADLHAAGNDAATIVKVTNYPKRTVYDVVKRLKDGRGIEHKPCGPHKAKKRTKTFLAGLKRSIKANPAVSIRAHAARRGLSRKTMAKAIKEDLGLTSYVRGRRHLLTEKMKAVRLERSRKLRRICKSNPGVVRLFSDESIFTVDGAYNPQNDRWLSEERSDVVPTS